jgi:hypothetical protein
MFSEIFRLIIVIGGLSIAAYTAKFLGYPKGEKENYKSFFWLFVAFAFHHAALAFTALLSEGSPSTAIAGYELAIVFYFAVLFFAMGVLRQLRLERKRSFDFMGFFILFLGAVALLAYALNPVLPYAKDGFVVWGSRRLFGLICGLAGFAVGTVWSVTFLEGWSNSLGMAEKVKAMLLSVSGLFLGISCAAFFLGISVVYFMADYTFTFLGIACAVAAVFLPKFSKSKL